MKIKRVFFYIVVLIYVNLFVFYATDCAIAQERKEELFLKSDALIQISSGYIELKNFNKAEDALDAAYKIAGGIDEQFSRAIIFFEIADKYIRLNKNERAFQVARAIEFSDVRDEAFAKIAYRYLELGEYQKAQDMLKSIKDDFSRAWALYKMINKFTDSGLYQEALKITRAIETSRIMANKLIIAQIVAKKILNESYSQPDSQFLLQFKLLDEPYRKSKELIQTAQEYFALNLYEPAKNILSKAVLAAEYINPESLRDDILYQIKIVYNKIAEFEKSLNIPDDKNQ